ncbi:gustatory receptor for sugar taste 43a-like [Diorhabda sublineata]|uniref:gustatory receptor for sugar taste 43a-like n=1 Tax=Diorhabda sublineata TaxID=1163346 RepID=UPI0024E067F6|nr:gustatory receptor for sugar taste 43a-like [Diorhabda sublineata]
MIVDELVISVSVFEAMEPLIVTSRLFGLFPITYTNDGKTYRLNWSIAYGLYTYTLSLVLAVATVLGLISDIKKHPKDALRMTDEKTRFVTCGDISIVIIIVVFAAITVHSKIRKIWKLMIVLNKTDNIIPFKNSGRIRKTSIYFISTVVIATVFVFTYDIILKSKGKDRLDYLKTYLSFYVSYFIVIMMAVFYWHVIFLIKTRITSLNDNLKAARDLNLESNFCMNMVGLQHLHDSIPNSKRNSIKDSRHINTIVTNKKDSPDLGKNKILEAVAIVNNSMELCIHILMLSCLLHLIVTPYFLVVKLLGSYDVFLILIEVIWLSAHIGRTLIIVEPCQICIDEHKKTSNLIYELLIIELDEQVKNSLTLLLMQLNNWKLNFSPCGFFKINRSLLTSIAGAVTTYLVILFQFKDP